MVGDRLFVAVLACFDGTQAARGPGLAQPVAQALEDDQCLPEMPGGLVAAAHPPVVLAQAEQGRGLTRPVPGQPGSIEAMAVKTAAASW